MFHVLACDSYMFHVGTEFSTGWFWHGALCGKSRGWCVTSYRHAVSESILHLQLYLCTFHHQVWPDLQSSKCTQTPEVSPDPHTPTPLPFLSMCILVGVACRMCCSLSDVLHLHLNLPKHPNYTQAQLQQHEIRDQFTPGAKIGSKEWVSVFLMWCSI